MMKKWTQSDLRFCQNEGKKDLHDLRRMKKGPIRSKIKVRK